MNLYDVTVNQLKRAVAIRERIEALSKELRGILGAPENSSTAATNNRGMNAAVRRKIAAQRARGARLRRSTVAPGSAERVAKAKKKTMSAAARRLSVRLKAYRAAKKKAGKK